MAVLIGQYIFFSLKPADAYHAAELVEPIASQSSLTLKGDVKEIEVERTVVVKDKVKVATLPVTITAPAGATDYRWKYPTSITATDDDSETLEITDAPNGTLTVSVRMKSYSIVDGKIVVAAKTLQITFTVGEVVPPKPVEPPKPINPVGFRVLLVHEAQEAAPTFFDSRNVKLYLDAKTVKDGSQPSWRRIDKDNPGLNLPKDLRLMWEAARPKVTNYPSVVIAVNGDVTIHELPKDEAAMIQLLKSKGGE